MKKTILAAYAVFFIAALLPWVFPHAVVPASESETSPATTAPEPAAVMLSHPIEAAAPSPAPTEAPTTPLPETGTPAPSPEPVEKSEPVTIRVLCNGEVVSMDMEDYVVAVTAAEMPASFDMEALKAQTVAARSYALYCAEKHKHGDAEVCTDPGCCQAWSSVDELKTSWGGRYEEYLARLWTAADATRGQILSYEGKAVFAAFHSSSPSMTEDCGAIWEPTPYLLSVSSPETASDVPGYVSEVYCSPLDFRDTVLSAHPEADFSGDESGWIGTVERDASGRVSSVSLGGVTFSGTELRSLFSLRSTAFELVCTDGCFVFTVMGFGHGVGMSQYGANVMAQNGADYTEILAHYYPGTALTDLHDVA